MGSRLAPASRQFRRQWGSRLRPSKPLEAPPRARESRRPGLPWTCRSAATVSRARSCRQARCSPPMPSRAMQISTVPWRATSAVAARIRVSAPRSRTPRATRRCEMATRELASSSRRSFLTATAAIGGGLLLGFGLPARGEVRDTLTTDAPFTPNAFLRIDRSGKVTFVSPMIEMGQGTYTSLPMLIAEELEVDVDTIAIEHSPADDKVYANPAIGVQMTGASKSIRGFYGPLREAGAAARAMLVKAAAQRWKVDPSTCHAEHGVVAHPPTGRKLNYGALVDAAAKLRVPEKVELKDPAQFKLIG